MDAEPREINNKQNILINSRTKTMKRFLLFVMMCVCVSIGTWADVSIREGSTADEVIVEVTGDSYGQFASHNFTDDELTLLNRTKLTLVGKFNSDDLNKFSNLGKNKATTVNFWDAEFASSVKTINSNWDGGYNYYNKDVEVSDQTFKPWESTVTTIVMSDKVTGYVSTQELLGNANNIKNATIAGEIDVPSKMFCDKGLESVTFSSKVKSIGDEAFKCSKLAYVDFGDDSHITYIGKSAFQGAGQQVKDENGVVYPFPHNTDGILTIPNTVTVIDEYAFNNVPIKTIVINKESQLQEIKYYAFFYDNPDRTIAPLNDIYIYKDDAVIECDFDAFSPMHTDGQTHMGTVRTRLHYPPKFYSFYVGDWKSQINGGKVEGHDDLLALRKVIDGSGHQIDGEDVVCTPKTRIGWQRFVSSGIPVTFDMDWRTYSDIVDIKVPQYVDKVADVYIVCGYQDGKAVLKQMKQDDIIPAGTGIVIHHYIKDKASGGLLIFPHVTPQEAATLGPDALKPYRFVSAGDKRGAAGSSEWDTDEYAYAKGMKYVNIETRDYVCDGKSYHNYLEAIHCMGVKRAIYNAENGNYVNYNTLVMQAYSGQKVTYRNFFFGNGKKLQNSINNEDIMAGDHWNAETDGKMDWGFFRCVTDMYAINSKAFLHYPADVFTQSHSESPGTITEGITASAKTFDNMILLDEDFSSPSSVATGITTMDHETTTRNEGYYTIQGVKVSTPIKNGLYIHNGKKYVVK